MNDLIKVCEIALRSLLNEEVRVQQDFKEHCYKAYQENTATAIMSGQRDFEIRTYAVQELRRDVERIREKAYEEEMKKLKE